MGGKNTSSTSTYAPAQQAQGIYNDILGRAQNVASTPYQAYSGELTAPVNQQQQTGIQNINNASGIANPYLAQASQYGASGASPVANISQNDIQQYMNPYQQSVIQSTLANIGENNAQQQQQVLGNAAQRGALGGDRVGVAQAELARQQNLATNQTLAGLNSQNYSQAMQAAQGQQQNQQTNANRQAQAAYTFGNLGTTAQNTALQGAGAQLTAGGLQQQTQQAKDTAAYQQFMQQQAFPYQQTSWLAGINTPIAGSLGGTQTQTPAAPNMFSQVAGAGLGLAGLFAKDGGRIGYADGGATPFDFIRDAQGYIPKVPQITINKAPSYAMNSVNPNTASNASIMSGLGKLKGSLNGFGGFNDPGPSYGGSLAPEGFMVGHDSTSGAYAHGGLVSAVHAIRKGLMNYAGGGTVDSFNDRWNNFPVSQGGQGFGTVQSARDGMAQANGHDPAVTAWRNDNPLPDFSQPYVPEQTAQSIQPTQSANPMSQTAPLPQPENPLSFGALSENDTLPPNAQPIQYQGQKNAQRSGLFNLTDEHRQGLLAAGLGMLAGTSPFAGVNIGQGGLKGVEAMAQFRKEQMTKENKAEQLAIQRQGVEQRGKQMAQQAYQFGKTFDENVRQHDITAAKPIAIGAGQSLVDRQGNVLMKNSPSSSLISDDDTRVAMAQQYLAGDKSVLTNLGRGAQGAENILALRQEIQKQAKLTGLDAAGIANKMAEFSGQMASQRTLGNRIANIELAVTEAQQMMPLALKASEAVDRTRFPTLNRILLAGEKGVGDENVVRLGVATNSLINIYARAISPTGVPTVHDKEHARELLSAAWAKGQYKAGVDQLGLEMAAAQRSPDIVKNRMRELYGSKKPEGAADAAPKVGEEKQFKQGIGVWDGKSWVPKGTP